VARAGAQAPGQGIPGALDADGDAGVREVALRLADALRAGADAALAASIFHYGQFTVGEAKRHLADAGIAVRV